jgi:hypothetical protein
MPDNRLKQIIRRDMREGRMDPEEAFAIRAACEYALECINAEFLKRYGTVSAADLIRLLEPITPPEANGAPHGRQTPEAPPLGTATH